MNRVVTEADITDSKSPLKAGHILLDTPTRMNPDGTGKLSFSNISASFKGFSEKIWLDCNKLPTLNEIRFSNGSETNPWPVDGIEISPLPGTQLKIEANELTHPGYVFLVHGLKYLHLNFTNDAYPGLTKDPYLRKFMSGAFGLKMNANREGGQMFSITMLDGGVCKINGIEVSGGFAAFRIQGLPMDWKVSLELDNFYLHDSRSGELIYAGSTKEAPFVKLTNVKIRNGLLVRSACESLQVQHLSETSLIENIQIVAPDTDYLSAFQNFHSTVAQYSIESGIHVMRNITIDGGGSNVLNLFGSDDRTVDPESKVEISNILFNDFRGIGIYPHVSLKGGMIWNLSNLIFRKANNLYYENTGVTKLDFFIDNPGGTDRISFNKIIYDNSKKLLFRDPSKYTIGEILNEETPDIEYINSGFYEPMSCIKQWTQFYGYYFPVSKGGTIQVPVFYRKGWILIDSEDGHERTFHKCLNDHTATSIRPKNDNINYLHLTWDANGMRNDQPAWNKELEQSNQPPDILILKTGSYYKEKGMGLDVPDEIWEGMRFFQKGNKMIFIVSNGNRVKQSFIQVTDI